MYKGSAMPSILKSKMFNLRSIDLIHRKLETQQNRYLLQAEVCATKDDMCHNHGDTHKQQHDACVDDESSFDYKQYMKPSDSHLSETTQCLSKLNAYKIDDYVDTMQHQNDKHAHEDETQISTDTPIDVNIYEFIIDTQVYASARCEVLYSRTSSKTQRAETLLALCIPDVSTYDTTFDYDALDAIQQFVNMSRHKLQTHATSPFQGISSALVKQCIDADCTDGIMQHELNTVQLRLQLNENGTIVRYINIYANTDTYNHCTVVKRNDTIDGSNSIPQINYQCLYDSLDALFAIIYANVDPQFLVSVDSHLAYSMLYDIFKDMHFPGRNTRGKDKHDVTLYMPISFILCSSRLDTGERVDITELTHMSVLLSLHSHFMPTEETFAYQLALELIRDIKKLWNIRKELMPAPLGNVKVTQYNCDLFKYGIVLVTNDTLPYDFNRYFTIRTTRSTGNISSAAMLCNALTYGTTEMCVWGYTLSCVKDAIYALWSHQSVETHSEVKCLTRKIERLTQKIDKRFSYFHPDLLVQPCHTFFSRNMVSAAGSAMPLFCMAICGVIDLSCTLHNITQSDDTYKYELNTSNLMRISAETFATLNSNT